MSTNVKKCSKCKKEKSFSEFYKDKQQKNGYGSHCKVCKKLYPPTKKQLKNNQLKFCYNITLEMYEILYAKQKGLCIICGKEETHRNQYGLIRLSVDHNHKTGRVRGLLCHKCNRGLGCFEENKNLLSKAIQYLEENK